MTAVIPYVSKAPQGRAGFAQLVRAEWTKFRTIRAWVIGSLLAVGATVVFGLLGSSVQGSCNVAACDVPTGPGGEAVADGFTFVHRSLAGDGSITARVGALTAEDTAPPGERNVLPEWAKAGVIVKASTKPGSAYAAVLLTPGHGVRMQYDFTHDLAGPATARWVRLTRAGRTLTGYASADGVTWTRIGSARLSGLPQTVEAGMFTTSPQYTRVSSGVGLSAETWPTTATARFDQVRTTGGWASGAWHGTWPSGQGLGPEGPGPANGFQESGGVFTVTGTGDIAPDVAGVVGLGVTPGRILAGAFAGLIAVVVIGALYITAEHRRGLIRTTLVASPRRARVLAAKALVLGAVAFAVGMVGAAITVPLGDRMVWSGGGYVIRVAPPAMVRVIVGTGLLFAAAAVLALGIGSILRRSAVSVAAVIMLIIVPYILAYGAIVPPGATQWLARITPAAAFAIQQVIPRYHQVSGIYAPAEGFYPLSPWAGLGVLCAYAAVALGAAMVLLRRRDA